MMNTHPCSEYDVQYLEHAWEDGKLGLMIKMAKGWGIEVAGVKPESPLAGFLNKGDVIIGINGTDLSTLGGKQTQKMLQGPKPILFRVAVFSELGIRPWKSRRPSSAQSAKPKPKVGAPKPKPKVGAPKPKPKPGAPKPKPGAPRPKPGAPKPKPGAPKPKPGAPKPKPKPKPKPGAPKPKPGAGRPSKPSGTKPKPSGVPKQASTTPKPAKPSAPKPRAPGARPLSVPLKASTAPKPMSKRMSLPSAAASSVRGGGGGGGGGRGGGGRGRGGSVAESSSPSAPRPPAAASKPPSPRQREESKRPQSVPLSASRAAPPGRSNLATPSPSAPKTRPQSVPLSASRSPERFAAPTAAAAVATAAAAAAAAARGPSQQELEEQARLDVQLQEQRLLEERLLAQSVRDQKRQELQRQEEDALLRQQEGEAQAYEQQMLNQKMQMQQLRQQQQLQERQQQEERKQMEERLQLQQLQQQPQQPQREPMMDAACEEGARRTPTRVADPVGRIAESFLATQSPAVSSPTRSTSQFDNQIVGMLADVMSQLQQIQTEVFETRDVTPGDLQDALTRRGVASPSLMLATRGAAPPSPPSNAPSDYYYPSSPMPEQLLPPTSQEADDTFSFMCRAQLAELKKWFARARALRPGMITDVEAVAMLRSKATELADSRKQARRQLNAAEHVVIVTICECKDARAEWEAAATALKDIDAAAAGSSMRPGPERDVQWAALLRARDQYAALRKKMSVAQVRSNQLAFLAQQLTAALEEVEQRLSQMAVMDQYAATGSFGGSSGTGFSLGAAPPAPAAPLTTYPPSSPARYGAAAPAQQQPAQLPSSTAQQWLYGYAPPTAYSPRRIGRQASASPAAVTSALTLPLQHQQEQEVWRQSLSFY